MNNVIVSGAISYDRIDNIYSLGGITYNILSLSLDKNINVFPVTFIGKDIKEEFVELMEVNVNLKYTIEIEKTNRNVLHIYNDERYEFLTTFSPEIEIDMIKKVREQSRLILINPVMGWEFNLQTLKEIRNLDIPYKMMDIHSFALGTKENGERFKRLLNDDESETIKESFDIIQMNMREYYAFVHKDFPEGIDYFPKEKIVIVSDAERGAYVYHDRKLEHFSSKNPLKKHIVGAGDIFSGLFISFFLEKNEPFDSVRRSVECMENINGDTILEKINSIKEKFKRLKGL
uniref:Carbohydrate kinase PfkB domain-containing protein n=1 Tax=candidate division WOR-3 bacterium TaxID=2052148 RepID=A0A7C4YBI2_UNCW3